MIVKKISADYNWTDPKTTHEYREALLSTSWSWICLISTRLSATQLGIIEAAATDAYNRATIALAQLPIEYGTAGLNKRFDRSRWREVSVENPTPKTLHCEHPWSKKITKGILWTLGSGALLAGVKKEEMVEPFSLILDARQDTVLLPGSKLSALGVLSEAVADGLGGRYNPAIEAGKIILVDRNSGKHITPQDIDLIESRIKDQMSSATQQVEKLKRQY